MTLGLVLLGIAILLYIGSALVTGYFIEKSLPGMLERSARLPPDSDGKRVWEHTSGKGIVPRWVSILGLVAVPLGVAGLVILLLAWTG